jgi:hypothetical protein
MDNRPGDVADRTKGSREASDLRTFRLPVADARLKAREILDRSAQRGNLAIVEHWRQLPDGNIELSIRRILAED